MTTQPVTTNDISPSTGYTYNYTYLPPLAMVDVVPPAEGFSARPDWIAKVAAQALKILVNTIMIGIKSEGGLKPFAEKLIAELTIAARQINAETVLVEAIGKEVLKHGFPTTLPTLKVFLEDVIKAVAETITEDALGDLAQIIVKLGTASGRPASLEDYNQLF